MKRKPKVKSYRILKARLAQNGLTQRQFAAKFGFSVNTVYAVVEGRLTSGKTVLQIIETIKTLKAA